MGKLRNLIIVEIKKFIENGNGLTGDEWKDNYFAPTDGKSIHVSEVDYLKLNDKDLLRYLMYLLLERDRAIESKIRNTKYDN